MTRSELIDAVARAQNLDRATAERVVRAIFDAMTDALVRGDNIELRGLGSFMVRSYRPYVGRNPRNGSPVEVKPKRLPHFKVGKPMRRRIERGETEHTPPSQSDGGRDLARRAARG